MQPPDDLLIACLAEIRTLQHFHPRHGGERRRNRDKPKAGKEKAGKQCHRLNTSSALVFLAWLSPHFREIHTSSSIIFASPKTLGLTLIFSIIDMNRRQSWRSGLPV